MKTSLLSRLVAAAAFLALPSAPAHAEEQSFEAAFDALFSSRIQAPQQQAPGAQARSTPAPAARASMVAGLIPVQRQPMVASYRNPLEQQIAQLAEGSQGRIGVAAVDLATGQSISILGDQPFPMASTSKIAIVATYLEQVDQGRLSLTSEFPMGGQHLPAHQLIDLVITRSSNPATDALLAAVGGVGPVNAWARRAGIEGFNLTRDIATLVREDGRVNPADYIDLRDSSTPEAMVDLLSGLYQGRWLSAESRRVIISAMERCRTGARRIPALMPEGVTVAHKTGTLNNTTSDIGILTAPDGRSIAVAIYVTGQGTKAARDERIAAIARALYDGFAVRAQTNPIRNWASAPYGNGG